MNAVSVVKGVYEAFGRGDVPTILDKLDNAVEWETTVPVVGSAIVITREVSDSTFRKPRARCQKQRSQDQAWMAFA